MFPRQITEHTMYWKESAILIRRTHLCLWLCIDRATSVHLGIGHPTLSTVSSLSWTCEAAAPGGVLIPRPCITFTSLHFVSVASLDSSSCPPSSMQLDLSLHQLDILWRSQSRCQPGMWYSLYYFYFASFCFSCITWLLKLLSLIYEIGVVIESFGYFVAKSEQMPARESDICWLKWDDCQFIVHTCRFCAWYRRLPHSSIKVLSVAITWARLHATSSICSTCMANWQYNFFLHKKGLNTWRDIFFVAYNK
jgi:hypothetical protein